MAFRYLIAVAPLLLSLVGCGPGSQITPPQSATSDDNEIPIGVVSGRTRTGEERAAPIEPNVPFSMMGGGPRHHHRTRVPGPKQTPEEIGRFHCGGRIAGAPVIGPDGTIYVGAVDGTFNALDRHAKLRWSYICDAPIFSTAAVSQTGKVFIGCDDDTLLAFSIDGTLRWTYRMKQDVDSAPVIADDGTVFVGGSGLHALDGDGKKRFKVWLGGHVTASPAVRPDGGIAVGSHDHRFYTVLPDGTVSGVFDTKGPIHGPAAALTNNDVVFGSDDGHIYRLAGTGGLRWKLKTAGPVRAGFAVTEDEKRLFAASMDGAVYALNAETGAVVWKTETGRGIKASPMLDSEGMLYVGSRDHHMYALNAADGEIVWRLDLGFEIDAPVAIPRPGRLITADDGGIVRLFEDSK